MIAKEALILLKYSDTSDKKSAVNTSLTRGAFVRIIKKAIDKMGDDAVVEGIYEKRVYQAVRNMKHPKY